MSIFNQMHELSKSLDTEELMSILLSNIELFTLDDMVYWLILTDENMQYIVDLEVINNALQN